MKPLNGLARKLAIPLLVLAIPGWILYVIGFAGFVRSDFYSDLHDFSDADSYPDDRGGTDWFPYWAFMIAGPLLFIACFVDLIIGRWFTGIVPHVLLVIFILFGGALLYRDARLLFNKNAQVVVIENIAVAKEEARLGGLGVPEEQQRNVAIVNLYLHPVDASRPEDFSVNDFLEDEDLGAYELVEFFGCLWSMFFMILYAMTWPLFSSTSTENIE